MSNYPEDDDGDLDIRDILDELTNRSLDSLVGLKRCEMLLTKHKEQLTWSDIYKIDQAQRAYYADLAEAYANWNFIVQP